MPNISQVSTMQVSQVQDLEIDTPTGYMVVVIRSSRAANKKSSW